ncbi:MAG: M1 family aminopeptidase, partial [Thermoanaerobaculia bacterium]
MTRRICTVALIAICGLGFGAGTVLATDLVHHRMGVILGAESHGLVVTTKITLPEALADGEIEFLLNSALSIEESNPPVEKIPLGDFEGFFGINSSTEVSDQIELARYRVMEVPADGTLELAYAGLVDFGLSDPKEEYTRGFRETAGVLGEDGVYLAGSGFWYPYFDDGLVEFELEIGVPEGWHVISQGNGLSRDQTGLAHWVSGGPMDEIYVVGGPLVRYSEAAGNVEALVYLREEDDALAAKYLEATAQYVEMYRQLIGPYPYEKFALIENFWETGYGMPSFTLLGPRVIRFPFILHSSYPHEILHNWWGNSVFVDYQSGNWCEGLTAYLADHLIKEQRGQAEEYRRSSLQKYRDYVKEGRDFPLSEFRSRHSAATEAVGYGKTMMGFHMLRRLLGDEVLEQSLARFYRGFKGKRASFADVQQVLESTSGEELGWFFEQWVERAGAAALEVRVEEVGETGDGFVVTGTLAQTQKGEPLVVDVPIAVQTESGAERSVVRLEGGETGFAITTAERPLSLQVDPQFDLFRLLDPRETPSSIGQIFGAQEILAVLPAAAGAEALEQYRILMEGWQSDSHAIEVITDDKLKLLPADRSVWLLGRANKFAAQLFADDAAIGVAIDGEELRLGAETVPLADHSLVAVRRHPMVDELAIGWLVVEPGAAFPGMGRKLPHYGKYSYLAFEGDEPTNVVKGQWSSSESPLVVDLRPENERMTGLAAIPLEPRQALAELPPVFSEKKLGEHVAYLA